MVCPDSQSSGEGPCLEWVDGLAVLIACLINGFITALNNYKKNIRFHALESKTCTHWRQDKLVTVRRTGSITQVPVNEICVGDVVQLDTGEKIPAGSLLAFPAPQIINEISS